MGKTSRHPKHPFSAVAQRWQSYRWWEKAIAAVGLISFIGVIVILFLPIGKGPSLYKAGRFDTCRWQPGLHANSVQSNGGTSVTMAAAQKSWSTEMLFSPAS